MNCIICQDIGLEPLKENKSCNCKYKYHSSCWIDYVHSNVKLKCPMCRIEVTKKPLSKNPTLKHDNAPYRPEPTAPPSLSSLPSTSDNVQTYYREFQEVVSRSITNTQQNRVSSDTRESLLENSNTDSFKLSKFLKLLLCSAIITVVVTVIIVLL